MERDLTHKVFSKVNYYPALSSILMAYMESKVEGNNPVKSGSLEEYLESGMVCNFPFLTYIC